MIEDGENAEVIDDDEGQNCAIFTVEMLANKSIGVTFPITVTFLVSKSILNDTTPNKKKRR